MPDDDIAWVRATVLHALGGSKFEVKVERVEDGGGLKPRLKGSVVVDAAGPGFEGMDTLPLQVRNRCRCRCGCLCRPSMSASLSSFSCFGG